MSSTIILMIRAVVFPIVTIIYVSLTMFRVYISVRNVEKDALKHSFLSRFREQDKKRTMKRSRRIMIQGVLYSVAMILSFVLVFITTVIYLLTNNLGPELLIITAVLNPLQGFFNALIYLIPFIRKTMKTRRSLIIQERLSVISPSAISFPIEEEKEEEQKFEITSFRQHSTPKVKKDDGEIISTEDKSNDINIDSDEEEISPLPLSFHPEFNRDDNDAENI